MGFKWSKFGKLTGSCEDGRYLYITNDNGENRKISISKYSSTIAGIRKKIALLDDKHCIIRTSQNTGDWSEEIWFSEISIDGSYQGIDEPVHEVETDFESPEELSKKLEIANNTIAEQESIIEKQDKSLRAKNDKINAKDEKIQDEIAKNNQLQNELAEKDLEISKLRAEINDEFNSLPHKQKNKIELESKQLQELIEIGDMRDFEVRRNSHPRRELAFRIGIKLPETKSRVAMKILQHVDKNNWACELLDYNKKALVSIGHENRKGFFVKSFRNTNTGWFEAVKIATGKPDSYFKDSLSHSLDELVEIYNKVISKLV